MLQWAMTRKETGAHLTAVTYVSMTRTLRRYKCQDVFLVGACTEIVPHVQVSTLVLAWDKLVPLSDKYIVQDTCPIGQVD